MTAFNFSSSSKKTIKFTLAIVLAIFACKIVPIPFAFIFPLFAGHFILFAFDTQPVSFYFQLAKKVIIGAVLGGILAYLSLTSVIVFFVAFLFLLFAISYRYHQDGDELKAIFYLIGIILLPIYALIDSTNVLDFSVSYIVQVVAALIFVAVINKILPMNVEQSEDPKSQVVVEELPNKAWLLALVNTLVTAPILAVTLYYNLTLQFLFLTYTCIITLQPQFRLARKHAFEYFTANIVGGGLAVLMLIVWVFFNDLAMNQYANLLLVVFTGILLIALLAYKTSLTSFASFAMTPFILVLFSIGDTWQDYVPYYSERVYLIGAAGLYSFIMLWLTKKVVSGFTPDTAK